MASGLFMFLAVLVQQCASTRAARIRQHQVTTSSSNTTGYKLPKKCVGGYFESQHCCTCTGPNRGGFMELGVWIKSCASLDQQSNKMCCETWATDCEEGDPWFDMALKKECKTESEVCTANECSDVASKLTILDDELDAIDKKYKDLASLKRRFITGVRDNNWCKCSCGDLLDVAPDGKVMCVAKKGLTCTAASRECCASLKDCDDPHNDPWPKKIKADVERVVSLKRELQAEKAKATEQRNALLKLERRCVKQCREQRSTQCLAELRQKNSKGKTNQYARAQAKWNAIQSAQGKREAELAILSEYWDDKFEQERLARDAKLDAQRKRQQLIRLHGWVMNLKKAAIKVVDKVVVGNECCECQKESGSILMLNWKLSVNYCTAPQCRSAAGCQSASSSFCNDGASTAC